MKQWFIFLIWGLWCLPNLVQAQVLPDSLKAALIAADTIRPGDSLLVAMPDSSKVKKFKLFGASDFPNPTKALIFSAIVPGGGQIYNRDWWKLPFVYGGFGFMVYLVDFNSTQYLSLRRQYKRSLRDLPYSSDLPGTTLKTLRDQADKNRQLSYIGIFGMYVFSAAEAFVDAHLKSFDVDDDISLRLKPAFETSPISGPVIGVGIRLRFE